MERLAKFLGGEVARGGLIERGGLTERPEAKFKSILIGAWVPLIRCILFCRRSFMAVISFWKSLSSRLASCSRITRSLASGKIESCFWRLASVMQKEKTPKVCRKKKKYD